MSDDAPVKSAVTYCRISSDRFGEQAGVDRQRVDTDRIAETEGWKVVERIVDNDRSASRYAKRSREGWDRLMELVEAGGVDAVVAYDLDRLTRQPKELERLIDAAENGLTIRTAVGALDLSSEGGILVARMLNNVAAHEADRASKRQKAKLRHDAEQGRPHWPSRPFGFTLKGEPVPNEVVVLNAIVDRVIAGESLTSIAKSLNDDEIAQPSGKPWQSASVKFLVTAARNAGVRTYKGEETGPAAWPAIVTEARYRSACSAVQLRSRPKRGGRVSLLTGMVECGRCGAVMYRTGAGDRAEYRCMKREGVGDGCGNSMRARHVDEVVVSKLLEAVGDVRGQVARSGPRGNADQLRQSLDDLAEMVGRGDLSMSEWKAARDPLQERLRAAEASEVRQGAGAALSSIVGGSLADRWESLDVDYRHKIAQLVIDKVTIGPAESKRLDLGRVLIGWQQ